MQVAKIRAATIYADCAIEENKRRCDVIDTEITTTIPGLFEERVRRSPDKKAYSQFDPVRNEWVEYTWQDMANDVNHWRRAIAADGMAPGQRAAIRMANSREWVLFDQAVLAQGLIVVPVYVEDRADNIAYILVDTETRLLLLEKYSQWLEMEQQLLSLTALKRVVIVHDDTHDDTHRDDNDEITNCGDARVMSLNAWLASAMPVVPQNPAIDADDLATIVYTSGTTGKPKGVMLSHSNMFLNAYGGLQSVAVYPSDQFLSFLPLSHMFERTAGYYLTMMAGAAVAFSRSVPQLLDDMAEIKPTCMIAVPRIFERACSKIKTRLDAGPKLKKWLFEQAVSVGWQCFENQQGRSKWRLRQCFRPILNALVAGKVAQRFGGRLRFVVSGGARLSPNIAKVFIGLGIKILQGYGLTESSPVLTVNTLSRNKPCSIGLPLHGAELRLGDNDELQAKGRYIMMGYWNNPQATAKTIDSEGWLMTGDIANISEQGFISITGRIKEIIILANGEKVPPADMESAIIDDPLFEQAMVIGEGKACLTALIVLSPEVWPEVALLLGVDRSDKTALQSEKVKQFVLDKIADQLTEFPGYAFIRQVTLSTDVWSVSDGAITPTLKLKRPVLMERFKTEIELMYNPP
ncbi:AMP-dependent synthetase/ligase [Candidatus Spongiihabitans sp.]|uniref:AMP-dependent synthetase/ligase n=1 Tax=Candidatus Spongiihabitans sp. TaxID=3101308 RepID=UPI003C6ECE22